MADGALKLDESLYTKAKAGGSIKVFGKSLADLSLTVLDLSKSIASANFDFPLSSAPPALAAFRSVSCRARKSTPADAPSV